MSGTGEALTRLPPRVALARTAGDAKKLRKCGRSGQLAAIAGWRWNSSMVTGSTQAQAIGSRFDAAQAGQVVQLQQALAADAVRMLHRPVGIAGDHRFPVGKKPQQFAIGRAQGMAGLGDGGRQQAEVGCLVEAERPARQMVTEGRHRPANAAVAGAATQVAAGRLGQGLAIEQGTVTLITRPAECNNRIAPTGPG